MSRPDDLRRKRPEQVKLRRAQRSSCFETRAAMVTRRFSTGVVAFDQDSRRDDGP
jgi:hypothetical protein